MKADLASVVNSSNGSSKAAFTKDELRELFTLKSGTCCDTRDLMLSGHHAEAWQVCSLDAFMMSLALR
jgi:hypothetical protein